MVTPCYRYFFLNAVFSAKHHVFAFKSILFAMSCRPKFSVPKQLGKVLIPNFPNFPTFKSQKWILVNNLCNFLSISVLEALVECL